MAQLRPFRQYSENDVVNLFAFDGSDVNAGAIVKLSTGADKDWKVDMTKERGAWHVDMLNVDSRYKGNNLAIKVYKFLMRKMDITLKAGSVQSAGGRYVWNKLSKTPGVVVYAKKSPYSKVIDFPKAGKRELVGKMFDLYGTNAEIFAVAG